MPEMLWTVQGGRDGRIYMEMHAAIRKRELAAMLREIASGLESGDLVCIESDPRFNQR